VLEDFPAWAAVGVIGVVVGEVVAREGAVGALGVVEHRDVWLDAALMHQPGEVIGGAVAGVGRKLLGPKAEALMRAIDHPALRRHLGLSDRCRCLHIQDDGVLQVDQIVGAVGEEGEPAIGSRPARGRIGGRDKLY